jgi:hypothetical protein
VDRTLNPGTDARAESGHEGQSAARGGAEKDGAPVRGLDARDTVHGSGRPIQRSASMSATGRWGIRSAPTWTCPIGKNGFGPLCS